MLAANLISPETLVQHFAAAGISISERELRRRARELGACRELGKALFFTPADVEKIIEASITPGRRVYEKCQNSESAVTSGTILSPSPESAFEEARRRLTASSRKMSRSGTNSASVVPLSTAKKPS